MDKTIISVALCTFNGGKYIKEQLESIINQTRVPDEIVICDDGSYDDTIRIIETYMDNSSILFRVMKNEGEPLGVINNFEKAISLTSGELIFLSDQDDIWCQDKVETMLNFFNLHPDAIMLFTNGFLVNESGQVLGKSLWEACDFNDHLREEWKDQEKAFYSLLKDQNRVTGATVAFRKELKSKILPFDLPQDYFHDLWIALQAAKLKGLYFLEQKLISYRIHPDKYVGTGNGQVYNKKLLTPIGESYELSRMITHDTFQLKILFSLRPLTKTDISEIAILKKRVDINSFRYSLITKPGIHIFYFILNFKLRYIPFYLRSGVRILMKDIFAVNKAKNNKEFR
jgi:glycosyltransferase involved in cell wall biosynthesis